MLKFFFHRNGKMPRIMEVVGVLGFVAIVVAELALPDFRKASFATTFTTRLVFGIYTLAYIFIRFCASFDFYRKFKSSKVQRFNGDEGIQLHFKKMLVAAAYTIALTNIAVLFGLGATVYFAAALLLFAAHVNAIFLYFHWKDNDPTPPNYFSCLSSLRKQGSSVSALDSRLLPRE